jgi:hypothetical protein
MILERFVALLERQQSFDALTALAVSDGKQLRSEELAYSGGPADPDPRRAAGHAQSVFFLDTGEPFRTLHHPQVRWRRTLQSLKLRYRRPYTARQTSVSWNLMVGKNPLWVAKQHGHSIATMLRAYAAWAEGTAEVDVDAIKRSMDQTVPLPTEILAVDLPVDKEVQTLSAPVRELTSTPGPSTSLLNQQEKMEEKSSALCGWGGRIRTSEWRDQNMDQDNQQVAEITDRRVPSSPFDSPSLPPNLPPAIGETAVVLGPARGTTNYLLLSANLRHPTGPCHANQFGRRRISASPGTIRRSRGKSHFISSVVAAV